MNDLDIEIDLADENNNDYNSELCSLRNSSKDLRPFTPDSSTSWWMSDAEHEIFDSEHSNRSPKTYTIKITYVKREKVKH